VLRKSTKKDLSKRIGAPTHLPGAKEFFGGGAGATPKVSFPVKVEQKEKTRKSAARRSQSQTGERDRVGASAIETVSLFGY